MKRLFDLRMHDGARHFASFPQSVSWYEVRDHVPKLASALLTGFVCDGVTEAWIDFTYREHRFSINDQFGEYWLFVENPSCPEEILRQVLGHFEELTSLMKGKYD